MNGQDLQEIRDAVKGLQHLTASDDVTLIRQKQATHFKINQKFPAYIDIGLSVWERLNTLASGKPPSAHDEGGRRKGAWKWSSCSARSS